MERSKAGTGKIALGILSLNIESIAGDPPSAHRYCTQVIAPLLDLLRRESWLRFSFSVTGSELEFLGRGYPALMDEVRALASDGRIELISPLYTPSLWWQFPGVDLDRSVEINRACLDDLGLPLRRVFFARGLFGAGLQRLRADFDYLVCRDDHVAALAAGPTVRSSYGLGSQTVLLAANHILHTLAEARARTNDAGDGALSLFAARHLEDGMRWPVRSSAEVIDFELGGTRWHWFHAGGAHHFTSRKSPRSWEGFFLDEDWLSLVVAGLNHLRQSGFVFGSVAELGSVAAASDPSPMPLLPEFGQVSGPSDLDPEGRRVWRSAGGAAVLSCSWRSRNSLRRREMARAPGGEASAPGEARDALWEAWRQQLQAESIGATTAAFPAEAGFGRNSVEAALSAVAQAVAAIGAANPRKSPRLAAVAEAPLGIEIFGAEGRVGWFAVDDGVFLCQVTLRPEEAICGVRFACEPGRLAYCPSGLEDRIAELDWNALRVAEVYLPLANGLVRIAPDRYLIRINTGSASSARASSEPWLAFLLDGASESREAELSFLLLQGEPGHALAVAAAVNWA